MKQTSSRPWHPIEVMAAVLVLAVLFLYTYALLFVAPYPGFYMNPVNGEVVYIFEDHSGTGSLKLGDIVTRFGSVDFEEYKRDKNLVLFDDAQAGQVVDLQIQRDGEESVIPWIYTGFTSAEFWNRVINNWLLGYVFWSFGTATLLFIRPRDTKWMLLTAANYLTGLFIVFGSLSGTHVWYSPLLMRCMVWLMTPVYIHFHWIFPSPWRQAPKWLGRGLYIFSLGMAALSLFSFTTAGMFYAGLFLAFGISLAILIIRAIRQTTQVREVRRLAFLVSLAFLPILVVSLMGNDSPLAKLAPLALFFLLLLPGGYFYSAFRTRLGGMEVRANRAISLFVFLILLSVILLLAGNLVVKVKILSGGSDVLFLNFLLAIFLAVFLSIIVYPRFEAQVEQRILGIKLPHKNLSETYSTRIVSSASTEDLARILKEEVFPSMFVRQFAFLEYMNGTATVLVAAGVGNPKELIQAAAADIPLTSWTEGQTLPSGGPPSLEWVQASLPLKVGDTLLGLWLLGRRDPDDLYSQAEMPVLQSLANQTAIAMSNILQTKRLKSMYQANVDRYEQERLRLARELHDSVLNEMAALLMFLDPSAQTPKFQSAYDTLVRHLREIVTELRPPMMNYGFKLALDELADHLSEIHNDLTLVEATVQGGEDKRYPQSVEHHIYRMVQEASENAIHHGKAGRVLISGSLDENCIDLSIEDDGSGFDADETTQLDHLVAQKHFGLAGMMERAQLIGAQVRFNSLPKQGTRVTIQWKSSS